MEPQNRKTQSMEPMDSTTTTNFQGSTSSHPTSLDEDNARRVDERDYGRQHTDSSSPVYQDETYRSGDMADRKQTLPGTQVTQPASPASKQNPGQVDQIGQGSSAYDPNSKATGSGSGYSGSNSSS